MARQRARPRTGAVRAATASAPTEVCHARGPRARARADRPPAPARRARAARAAAPAAAARTHYEVLSIALTARRVEVRKVCAAPGASARARDARARQAYTSLALRCHPDKASADSSPGVASGERFKEISEVRAAAPRAAPVGRLAAPGVPCAERRGPACGVRPEAGQGQRARVLLTLRVTPCSCNDSCVFNLHDRGSARALPASDRPPQREQLPPSPPFTDTYLYLYLLSAPHRAHAVCKTLAIAASRLRKPRAQTRAGAATPATAHASTRPCTRRGAQSNFRAAKSPSSTNSAATTRDAKSRPPSEFPAAAASAGAPYSTNTCAAHDMCDSRAQRTRGARARPERRPPRATRPRGNKTTQHTHTRARTHKHTRTHSHVHAAANPPFQRRRHRAG